MLPARKGRKSTTGTLASGMRLPARSAAIRAAPATGSAIDRSSSAELVAPRGPLGGRGAGLATLAAPFGHPGLVALAVALAPGQPLGIGETFDVGQPAVLVALQDHAATPGHLGQLLEREEQQLPVPADHRHRITLDEGAGRGLDAVGQV